MKMDYKDDTEAFMEEGKVYSHGEHKSMTFDDVVEELKRDFAEEIADSDKYYCMAKAIKRSCHDNDDACHYLLEISKDECTHAMFIHKFLTEYDICIPEEQERDFEKLKMRMAKFF